jgi:uncharacterized protein (TIGR03067 family)
MLDKLFFPLVLMLFFSLVARSTDAKDADTKDADAIQGIWLPTAAELAAEQLPDDIRKTIKLVIKGDHYLLTVGTDVDKGTVKLNPSTKPKSMDITGIGGPNNGKTILAIYDLDGDTLRICSGKSRPTEFKTKADAQLFLVTYRRENREK